MTTSECLFCLTLFFWVAPFATSPRRYPVALSCTVKSAATHSQLMVSSAQGLPLLSVLSMMANSPPNPATSRSPVVDNLAVYHVNVSVVLLILSGVGSDGIPIRVPVLSELHLPSHAHSQFSNVFAKPSRPSLQSLLASKATVVVLSPSLSLLSSAMFFSNLCPVPPCGSDCVEPLPSPQPLAVAFLCALKCHHEHFCKLSIILPCTSGTPVSCESSTTH